MPEIKVLADSLTFADISMRLVPVGRAMPVVHLSAGGFLRRRMPQPQAWHGKPPPSWKLAAIRPCSVGTTEWTKMEGITINAKDKKLRGGVAHREQYDFRSNRTRESHPPAAEQGG
ncbi:MAG: hypothetical protein R3F36_14440 [Candidatus Competibacteraceae bacterium]